MEDWSSPFSFSYRPVKKEPAEDSRRRLYCDACGGEEFDSGDDGFYYCSQCGAQSQDIIDTATADEDIYGEGGLYSLSHTRARSQPQNPNPMLPSKDEVLKALSQSINGKKEEKVERPYGFEDEVSEPRDFGSGSCPDAEMLADGIRMRYVQGLQVMLQRQSEVLVEKFGVSPLIIGIVGTIWLRYVATSRVFDEGWADKVIKESEAEAGHSRVGEQEKSKKPKIIRCKYKSEPHNLYGQRAIYIWLRSLRKTIPVYSSLAISFLVCHLAREPILPTDIFEWALEGKLPYLAAFVDMDKYLGNASNTCPLSSRQLFRPNQVIGAWQLEAAAASIAQTIGLRIPSVNFYAIARRYLKELYLPVEKILLHACRLYMWSIPADLWLSSNASGFPTRVCVMSILIVTIRILYNIYGQGTWEMSQSDLSNSPSYNHRAHLTPDSTNLSSAPKYEYRDGDAEEHCNAANLISVKNISHIQTSEYNTKELLSILEATYDKIHTTHDYSKDLLSYLKHCKDVVFAGVTKSYEEERLIERLWDMYEKQENDTLEEANTKFFDVKVKRPREGVSINPPLDPKKPKEESQDSLYSNKGTSAEETSIDGFVGNSAGLREPSLVPNCRATAREIAVEKMKLDMEENGFQYIPPRVQQRTDGYLHYKRQKIDGKLVYVAHADYYILLRACARLAQVDIRIMHLGVLKLERRLDWIEQQTHSSLDSLLSRHQNSEV